MTNLDEFLPYLMRRISTRIAEGIAQDLADIGLNHERWRVLAVLAEFGPQTLNKLARLVSINVSTLSRLIDRMIEEGLTLREPSGEGRAVRISIGPNGEAKLQQITPMIEDIKLVASETLTPEELKRLQGDLRRLYSAYDRFAAARIARHVARREQALHDMDEA